MLVGCFYIWVLAYEASLSFHVMTLRSGFLETDACENRKVFLWKKLPEKAVTCVRMFVQSRKSTGFRDWEEGDGDMYLSAQ